jgi:hypothetical protein
MLEQAREMFEMLYVSAAQYTIRFEPPSVAADGMAPGDSVAIGGRR